MDFKTDQNHVYLTDTVGKLVAHAEFVEHTPGVYDIQRTYVAPELRGQHIASQLVEKAVEEIHRRGAKVTASCSYAQAWLKKHQAYSDDSKFDI